MKRLIGRISFQLAVVIFCIYSASITEDSWFKGVLTILAIFNLFVIILSISWHKRITTIESHINVIDEISAERKREAKLKALRSPDPFPKDVKEFREFCKENIRVDSIVIRSNLFFLKKNVGVKLSDREVTDNVFCIYLKVPINIVNMIYEESDIYSPVDYLDTSSRLLCMDKNDIKWMLDNILEGQIRDYNGNHLTYDGESFMLTNMEKESIPVYKNLKVMSMNKHRKKLGTLLNF